MIKLNDEMTNRLLRNVYLSGSKVVRFPNNLYADIMLITASCGRGKSTFALSLDNTGLLAEINANRRKNSLDKDYTDIKPDEVLVLSSRIGITNQQLKNTNVVKAIPSDFNNDNIDFIGKSERKGKIKATTAHAFGEMIKRKEVKIIPKVIVIDEIHSIFAEYFAESLIYVIKFLEEHYKEIIKIGLTATPDFLINYVKEFSFKPIDLDIGTKYLTDSVRVVINGKANTILEEYAKGIDSKHKLIYYTQSATQCYLLSKQYANSAFLISDYNQTVIEDKQTKEKIDLAKIMKEAGVKQYIIDNEKLPDDINIIFINSACREGINIKDENVKRIICEAVDMITIEQILGRIRGNLEEYIVVANFNYKQLNDNNIKAYCDLIKSVEESENPQGLLGARHQKQLDNRLVQPFVYKRNQFYYINNYAKYYLQYIRDTYQQIENYEGRMVVSIGDRELKDYIGYFQQLERFAVNHKVEITKAQKERLELNHKNGIERFKEIECEWLGKPLGKEEKKVLCAELAMVRSGNKVASWKTVKDALLDAGYSIKQKRISSKNYDIICR